MLIQTCSLSLAKGFMQKALQGLTFAFCVKCCICSWICHVIFECEPAEVFFVCSSFIAEWEIYSVIFRFLDVKMGKMMLMSPIAPSSAI